MPNKLFYRAGVLMMVCAAIMVAGCGGGGKKKKNRLEGERIPILTFEQQLTPDPRVEDMQVVLPDPVTNASWPQAGGLPGHAMQHLALSDNPKRIWRVSIGSGTGGRKQLTSKPVVADGMVFAMDVNANVTALNATTGRQLWRRKLEMKGRASANSFGGGIAYAGGRIFATTGYGFIAALDAATGQELWRTDIRTPMRGAPAAVDGRVYATTFDNQLFAFSADTGEELWSHAGIIEAAGIMGASTPAVVGGNVIAAFSSGEIFALRAENGQVAWNDSVTRTGLLTPLASISDVDAPPVIDRGVVYATSHGGRTVAIDLRTGERMWEKNVGSLYTPWVAGEFMYIVSTESEVVCLTRRDGRVRWVTPLQRFKDVEDRKGLLTWAGPVLAGDRLIITSSHGFAISVSPYTGEILSGMKLSDKTYLPPVVADGTLYILSEDGDLLAMR
jgi:outer membrane protein assembly factor BamB